MQIIDTVMVIFIVLSIAILMATTLMSRMSMRSLPKNNLVKSQSLKTSIQLRNAWLSSSIICIVAHYWCILYSFFSTLAVLYLSCFDGADVVENKARIVLYSSMAFFINLLPYIINLKKLSQKYRDAYILIQGVILNTIDQNVAKVAIAGEAEIKKAFDD